MYCLSCQSDDSNNDNDHNNDNNNELKFENFCKTLKINETMGYEIKKNIKKALKKHKCKCNDYLTEIMTIGIDMYYNAIYVILKNKMLYRIEKNGNIDNNNDKNQWMPQIVSI